MSVYFHTVQNINLKTIGSCKEIVPPPQHWIQQSNQLTLLGRTPRCVCTDCLAYFSAQCELILNYNFILLLTNVLNSFQIGLIDYVLLLVIHYFFLSITGQWGRTKVQTTHTNIYTYICFDEYHIAMCVSLLCKPNTHT